MSGYGQFMFGAPAGSAVLREEDVDSTSGDDSTWVPYTPPPSVKVEDSSLDYNANLTLDEAGLSGSGSSSSTGSSIWDTLFGTKKPEGGVVGTLVNIFGQLVHPNGQVVPITPAPATPVWVYLAIPVALIGVIALIRRKKPAGAVAGYRRRSRRGKR